jgi:predicted component of viral defense system (DUF524 family)
VDQQRSVELPILDPVGRLRGSLRLSLLPTDRAQGGIQPILDLREDSQHDPSVEQVQLLEGHEYLYEINLLEPLGSVETDRPEIFQPDAASGERGRLRTGLYTGMLPVTVRTRGLEVGTLALEVRSRKLDYLSQYRWMLRDIAEQMAELVMERFAPTEQRFAVEEAGDAATLYQRFAFLRSLVAGESFEAAIRQVLARPHRAWMTQDQVRRPGQSLPASSTVARQLVAPGRRVAWRQSPDWWGAQSLPAQLRTTRTEETLDTSENRFIKFVLTRWREVIAQISDTLARESSSPAIRRGQREVQSMLDQLDTLLAEDLFRQVGPLTHLPAGSQVLHKREGYRDLFRSYVQFEAAALLSWQGGEDVYGAGQRDVATLYEFWVFLQLAQLLATLCGGHFNLRSIIEPRRDGLGLRLRHGQAAVLSGTATRLGRQLRIDLWFNRSFGMSKPYAPSWTRPMRPDCSVLIRPDVDSVAPFGEVWLHFDAKYRVEQLRDIFGGARPTTDDAELQQLDAEQAAESQGGTRRADLIKMHAYRDAIRRSAGSYVIYPGTDRETYALYHEILPGLGAFALRPSDAGVVEGAGALQQFMSDVLDHIASQVTQHERWRFWTNEIYSEPRSIRETLDAAPFLIRPPADTVTLLGYVKSHDHLRWIRENRRYNLRADGRRGSVGLTSGELGAELVILYGPAVEAVEVWRVGSEPELAARSKMLATGYPDPSAELYFCLSLQEIQLNDWPVNMTRQDIEALRTSIKPGAAVGEPVTTTWLEVVQSVAR